MSIITLWTVPNGQKIRTYAEQTQINLELPLSPSRQDIDVEIISGKLPLGVKLIGTRLNGIIGEVAIDTIYDFVLRAHWEGYFEDRSLSIVVTGPDDPRWITEEGLLPVGPNNTFFVLDNESIDFQLVAIDDDILAGEILEYFIANDDGELPPGLTLTDDGRLVGVTEPLLSLDKKYRNGGYDMFPFGDISFDYGLRPTNGFSSFFYDSQPYDYFEGNTTPRKLNRYYPFTVSVTDGFATIKREFKIYVVGDDFLRADNTLMQSSTGVFRADNTPVRNPIWITPRNLGYKRANNYVTIFLDVIDNETLTGVVNYVLEDLNDDGTVSELPPGLELSSFNGEISGYVPYQPAITKNYKFTVTATRIETDFDTVVIFGTYVEDAVLGSTQFKIAKIDLTSEDGVDDLRELITRRLFINKGLYTVTGVDDSNADYDVIFLGETLAPQSTVVVYETAPVGQGYVNIFKLSQDLKEKYLGRKYIFSNGSDYTITDIKSFITWEIRSESLENTNVTDFLNELIAKYEKSSLQTLQDFIDSNAVGFYNDYTIEIKENNRWWLTVKDTSFTRSLSKLEEYVADIITFDSSPPAVNSIKQPYDRFVFDKNLNLPLNQGRNIGLAIFAGEFFSERIVKSNTDETVQPQSSKTFELKIIGEIDSNIRWITPEDLGTLVKNKPSLIQIVAETSVPEVPMFYTIVDGMLPVGMNLSHKGNLIGKPQLSISSNNLITQNYEFIVEARDRFNLVAIRRKFTLKVIERDKLNYTDIIARPLLPMEQRDSFKLLVRNPDVFANDHIYRPNDPEFGLRDVIEVIVYSGIEKNQIEKFVSAAAKNHKRKKYKIGSPTKAIARISGTRDTVYEVVYLPVIDPYETSSGKTQSSFQTRSSKKITVDSVQYAAMDDNSKLGLGADALPVYSREVVKFVFEEPLDTVIIETRNELINFDVDNNDFEITIRSGSTVSVALQILDSEPKRIRPDTNTIKADSNAIQISQSTDSKKYISSIEHMRDNIRDLGTTDSEYMPLWMRTPQNNIQQLGYVNAIPLCYCKPGTADKIIENIKKSGYDFKQINLEIDRYIIKNTLETDSEQYILFANYQFNV